MAASFVIQDLLRWGPGQSAAPPGLPEAQAYCRALALRQYENFPVLTWALPRPLRQPFCDVYAFCRWADDLGDEAGSTQRASALLNWWREELDRCYLGNASHPVFVSLLPTIERFQIPREPFADLISAFLQDQSVREYESRAQLLDYCRRSANPVGRIVLRLCERDHDPQHLAWSDAICTGLQLANFWQDVARDADIGRCYLPREDRQRHNYTEEDLRGRRATGAFRSLLREEVSWARELLLEGMPLARRMPGRLRVEVDLFAQGGLLILREIEQQEYGVWDRRPVVRKSQLFRAGIGSLFRAWLP